MEIKKRDRGFTIPLVVAVLAIVLISCGASFVWYNHSAETAKNNTTETSSRPLQNNQSNTVKDLSEAGKYLYINEWGVRVALPNEFQDKVTYTLTKETDPDSGLPMETAHIYISSNLLTPNVCATTNSTVGQAINSGAQYIRSDNSKPFNSARYRGTFKASILQNTNYSFHLGYVTPDCAGGGSNTTKIEGLQDDLLHLEEV